LNTSFRTTSPSKRYFYSYPKASLALNINYSSAKAILSNHRKSIINSNKKSSKNCKRAEFRPLTGFESFLNPIGEFICTTGGKEVRRFDSYIKHRPIQKAPIILLAAGKDLEYMENTSNSQ
jgi:hypothetical protein